MPVCVPFSLNARMYIRIGFYFASYRLKMCVISFKTVHVSLGRENTFVVCPYVTSMPEELCGLTIAIKGNLVNHAVEITTTVITLRTSHDELNYDHCDIREPARHHCDFTLQLLRRCLVSLTVRPFNFSP